LVYIKARAGVITTDSAPRMLLGYLLLGYVKFGTNSSFIISSPGFGKYFFPSD